MPAESLISAPCLSHSLIISWRKAFNRIRFRVISSPGCLTSMSSLISMQYAEISLHGPSHIYRIPLPKVTTFFMPPGSPELLLCPCSAVLQFMLPHMAIEFSVNLDTGKTIQTFQPYKVHFQKVTICFSLLIS